MFYISKITPTYIYVTDTSDNVEEKFKRSDFWKIAETGIKIEGIVGEYIPKGNGTYKFSSYDLKVYNPNKTALDAKVSFMTGVDVSINEWGTLTNIAKLTDDVIKPIRLSNFCNSLADYSVNFKNTKSTLIFDSKIQSIGTKAFNNCNYCKIIIEEGTSAKVVEIIYKSYLKNDRGINFSSYITDYDNERLVNWQCYSLFNSMYSYDIQYPKIISRLGNNGESVFRSYVYNWCIKNSKKIIDYLTVVNFDRAVVSDIYYTDRFNNIRDSLRSIRSVLKGGNNYPTAKMCSYLGSTYVADTLCTFINRCTSIRVDLFNKTCICFKLLDYNSLIEIYPYFIDFILKLCKLGEV